MRRILSQAGAMQKRNGSIGTAVALFFALAALCLVLVTGARYTRYMEDVFIEEASLSLQEAATEKAALIGKAAGEGHRLLDLVQVNFEAPRSADSVSSILMHSAEAMGYAEMALVDLGGETILAGGGELILRNDPLIQSTLVRLDGRRLVYGTSPLNDMEAILTLRSFRRSDGRPMVLIVQDSVSSFLSRSQLTAPEMGASVLLSRSGSVIARPADGSGLPAFDSVYTLFRQSELDGESVTSLSLALSMRRSGSLQLSAGGTRFVMLYTPVPDTDWMLLTAVPQASVLIGARRITEYSIRTSIVMGALVGAGVLAAILGLGRAPGRRRAKGTPEEAALVAMSAQIDDVYFLTDAAGAYLFISPNVQRVLGVTDTYLRMPEAAGLGFLGEVSRRQFARYRDADSTQPIVHAAKWLHPRTGEERQLKITILPIRADGGKVFYTIAAQDDTVTQRTQQLLRQALASAEEASDTKTRFLSNMSHEIRTPMNAIIGMTRIGLEHAGDPVRVTDSLRKIEGASAYLMELINEVLDLSRIESGTVQMAQEVFTLQAVMERILSIQAPVAQGKGVALTFDSDGSCADSLLGDPLRVQQVLMNLIANGVKFTPGGGHVRVWMQCLRKDTHTVWVRFTIADSGVGISPAFLPEVFEPFTQERVDPRVSGVPGTGLGLAITKNLVTMLGGTIVVDSTQGQGTTFTVELAFTIAAENAGSQAERMCPEAAVPMGLTLLLAEDNALNTEIMLSMLEGLGAHTDAVDNGRAVVDAFALSDVGHYDCILMDIQMPQMDGLAATAAIRAMDRPDASTVPIIAITANAFREDITRSLQSGMDDHISKPVDPAELRGALSRAVEGRSREE